MMNINYNNMTAYQFQYALRNDYPEAMEFFKKHARKIDSGANWAAYKCDTIDWASNFAKHMLGVASEAEPERDPISPWLDELLQAQANMNLDTEFKVSKSSKTSSAINTSSDAGVSTAE